MTTRTLLLAATVAAIVTAFVFLDGSRWVREALTRVEGLGAWGPVLFIAIYIVAAVLFIPGSALTLGAGALFGVVSGSLLVSVASTLGAAAAFLTGRYLARKRVARMLERHPAFRGIAEAVGANGWKLVLLTRLSPVFPYNLVNYTFSLTAVKLPHYVVASWIGMMPGTVVYVWLGSLARTGAKPQARTPAQWWLYGIGLVATIAVSILIARIARKALEKQGLRLNTHTKHTPT